MNVWALGRAFLLAYAAGADLELNPVAAHELLVAFFDAVLVVAG